MSDAKTLKPFREQIFVPASTEVQGPELRCLPIIKAQLSGSRLTISIGVKSAMLNEFKALLNPLQSKKKSPQLY